MNISFFSARRTSVLILWLALLSLHCHEKPAPRLIEPRLIEPRLSGGEAWRPCRKFSPPDAVVEEADCGTSNLAKELVSLPASECEDHMTTATETVRFLAAAPQCTDAAVETLEALTTPRTDGRTDARLVNDLAAAYYVRAQRKNQPSDFVRSLDAAEWVVAQSPSLAEGRFNRALALEVLGFQDAAIDAWDALRHDAGSSWSKEAAEHSGRLVSQRSRTAAVQWNSTMKLLPMVAQTGDRRAVEQLVSPYRDAAQKYLERQVLPAWAAASKAGRARESAEQLMLAEMIASALARLTHDRYLLDGVERIQSAHDPRVLKQLEDGHAALGAAVPLGRHFVNSTGAMYDVAERELARAGSAFAFGAGIGRAYVLIQDGHQNEALTVLRSVTRAASEHHYPSLMARIRGCRGYLRMVNDQDMEAVGEYSEAQSLFRHVGDTENVGGTQDILGGLYRRIGHQEFTWRAAVDAERHGADLVDTRTRHVHLGENALSAVALGYPSVALRYQNAAVALIEKDLSRATAVNLNALRRQLGIARRTRAGIYAFLHQPDAAHIDLIASAPLMGDPPGHPDETYIPLGFDADVLKEEALRLSDTDRRRAIEKVSDAIRIASPTSYRSLNASLRIERADLFRLNGHRAAAAKDLEEAIAILREEEKAALDSHANTTPAEEGQLERLWSAYFSRSQEVYRRLIQIYMEDGLSDRAFEYAEKARGYEPLHRILLRGDVPAAFRNMIHDDEPIRLADVRAHLQAGTFLLEYSVHDGETYVWIIGNGVSDHLTLPVGEKSIKGWSRALQRFASLRDEVRCDAHLGEPYDALLERPLQIVSRLQSKHSLPAKIVIVPDRSMHGLPFAALRHAGHYLIQDRAVAVAGSATLYVYSLMQDRQLSVRKDPSVLLFADPRFNGDLEISRDLRRLTYARSEAERIHDVYARVAHVDPPYMDGDATVPAFLRLAAGNTIIHVAAHGIANPDVPSRSFLLLAPTGEDSGVIDAEGLSRQLQLTKTRLTVLSACSSAGGTSVGPEGLSPLVRPLIVAGVPGVVGTLWNVSDNLATEELLVRFHQYYRDGSDADEALRQAQIYMIDNRELLHHAVWGWSAFQMIGYASSPFPASAEVKRKMQ